MIKKNLFLLLFIVLLTDCSKPEKKEPVVKKEVNELPYLSFKNLDGTVATTRDLPPASVMRTWSGIIIASPLLVTVKVAVPSAAQVALPTKTGTGCGFGVTGTGRVIQPGTAGGVVKHIVTKYVPEAA